MILAYEQDERASADYNVGLSFSVRGCSTAGKRCQAFSRTDPLVSADGRAR